MKRLTIMYDISSTKLRNRLVKILEEFGERVQYSVFEFTLTKAQHVHLFQRLKNAGFMEGETENYKIRIYHHDKDDKTENFGQRPSRDNENLFYI